MNRRQAIQSSIVAAGVLAGTSYASSLSASDPIKRNGKPKFKFSLAAYSYRSLLTGKNPKLTLKDFVADCADFGLEGTELTSYYFPENPSPNFLRKLKQQCFQLGLDISGTAVGNDFGHKAGEERKKQIAHVKKWINFAEILGAPVIRIFAGHKKKDSTDAESHSLMVAGMEECCDYAGKHGVHLALENHGGPTASVDGLLKFVRDVKSPWFGINLDTGNFHSKDIYGDLAKAAPYALNVQVKVTVSGPDKKKKPTDFGKLAKILKDSNYRGYIVLEFEEKGDPRKECKDYLEKLKNAFEL